MKEGSAASIMGAYNRMNGEPCCASPRLLQKILREEWGFEGYVVSDCWAINDIFGGHGVVETPAEASALAVKVGCDLECGCAYPSLLEAVEPASRKKQPCASEAGINATDTAALPSGDSS